MDIRLAAFGAMTEFDVLSILAGCVCVLFATMGKQFYYRKKRSYALGNPAPLWLGRLVFGGVGAFFILLGFRNVLFG